MAHCLKHKGNYSDEFWMLSFKVVPCTKTYAHSWSSCPCAHPGETARRRDPTLFNYQPVLCPNVKSKSGCPAGDSCGYAHNVFEQWLHPQRYKALMCTYGSQCTRPSCFFAHSLEELRVPWKGTGAGAVSGSGIEQQNHQGQQQSQQQLQQQPMLQRRGSLTGTGGLASLGSGEPGLGSPGFGGPGQVPSSGNVGGGFALDSGMASDLAAMRGGPGSTGAGAGALPGYAAAAAVAAASAAAIANRSTSRLVMPVSGLQQHLQQQQQQKQQVQQQHQQRGGQQLGGPQAWQGMGGGFLLSGGGSGGGSSGGGLAQSSVVDVRLMAGARALPPAQTYPPWMGGSSPPQNLSGEVTGSQYHSSQQPLPTHTVQQQQQQQSMLRRGPSGSTSISAHRISIGTGNSTSISASVGPGANTAPYDLDTVTSMPIESASLPLVQPLPGHQPSTSGQLYRTTSTGSAFYMGLTEEVQLIGASGGGGGGSLLLTGAGAPGSATAGFLGMGDGAGGMGAEAIAATSLYPNPSSSSTHHLSASGLASLGIFVGGGNAGGPGGGADGCGGGGAGTGPMQLALAGGAVQGLVPGSRPLPVGAPQLQQHLQQLHHHQQMQAHAQAQALQHQQQHQALQHQQPGRLLGPSGQISTGRPPQQQPPSQQHYDSTAQRAHPQEQQQQQNQEQMQVSPFNVRHVMPAQGPGLAWQQQQPHPPPPPQQQPQQLGQGSQQPHQATVGSGSHPSDNQLDLHRHPQLQGSRSLDLGATATLDFTSQQHSSTLAMPSSNLLDMTEDVIGDTSGHLTWMPASGNLGGRDGALLHDYTQHSQPKQNTPCSNLPYTGSGASAGGAPRAAVGNGNSTGRMLSGARGPGSSAALAAAEDTAALLQQQLHRGGPGPGPSRPHHPHPQPGQLQLQQQQPQQQGGLVAGHPPPRPGSAAGSAGQVMELGPVEEAGNTAGGTGAQGLDFARQLSPPPASGRMPSSSSITDAARVSPGAAAVAMFPEGLAAAAAAAAAAEAGGGDGGSAGFGSGSTAARIDPEVEMLLLSSLQLQLAHAGVASHPAVATFPVRSWLRQALQGRGQAATLAYLLDLLSSYMPPEQLAVVRRLLECLDDAGTLLSCFAGPTGMPGSGGVSGPGAAATSAGAGGGGGAGGAAGAEGGGGAVEGGLPGGATGGAQGVGGSTGTSVGGVDVVVAGATSGTS